MILTPRSKNGYVYLLKKVEFWWRNDLQPKNGQISFIMIHIYTFTQPFFPISPFFHSTHGFPFPPPQNISPLALLKVHLSLALFSQLILWWKVMVIISWYKFDHMMINYCFFIDVNYWPSIPSMMPNINMMNDEF